MKTKLIKAALAASLSGLIALMAFAADFSYIQIQNGVSLTLEAGKTKDLSVIAYTSDNRILPDALPREYGTLPDSDAITWKSENPSVAYVSRSYIHAYDPDTKMYVYLVSDELKALSPGTVKVTATTTENAQSSDKPATATLIVNVMEKMSYMNIGADVWDRLYDEEEGFNKELSAWNMKLEFVDANPKAISAHDFQQAFSSVWGTTPEQVTDLNASNLSFSTRSSGPVGSWSIRRPGVSIELSGAKRGDLLPLKYIWSYTWNELSKLLGGTVSGNPGAERLFNALRVDFYGASGSTGSSVQYTVLGSGGVSAADAAGVKSSTPPLVVRTTATGVSIELTVYLANVQGASGPRLVDGLLIVPDGEADTPIAGTMWMLEGVSEGGNEGGSGGGCGVGLGLLALLPALGLALRSRLRL